MKTLGIAGSARYWALSYVGLSYPRKFERTLIFLGIALLASIIGIVATTLAVLGDLIFPSPRSWHFIYLAGLLVLSLLLLIRWPRLASAFLFLAALESLAGMGTAAAEMAGLTPVSLFPADSSYDDNGSRYTWHPLLQAVPIRSTTFAEGTVHHNSLGMRGPEQTPESLSGKALVALFGGSTTYDIALADGDIWPDRLAALLGRDHYAVLNYGVPGYSTVEAIIQTAFYESPYGLRPTCAVYFEGWNDVRNSHLTKLDSAYADFHLPSQVDANEAHRLSGPELFVSPLFAVSTRLIILAFDTVRPVRPWGSRTVRGTVLSDSNDSDSQSRVESASNTHPLVPRQHFETTREFFPGHSCWGRGKISGEPDTRLESLYARNVETISAINRQRGIKTIWIGQLLDRTRLTGDVPDKWVVLVPPRRTWPLVQRLNRILEESAKQLGDTYIFPSTTFGHEDFVDTGHFSESGAIKFARAVVEPIRASCH